MDCSPPGSSVHGIPQTRILKWVAILFSRGCSPPRDWTQVSFISGKFFTIWATREASVLPKLLLFLMKTGTKGSSPKEYMWRSLHNTSTCLVFISFCCELPSQGLLSNRLGRHILLPCLGKRADLFNGQNNIVLAFRTNYFNKGDFLYSHHHTHNGSTKRRGERERNRSNIHATNG